MATRYQLLELLPVMTDVQLDMAAVSDGSFAFQVAVSINHPLA